MNVWRPPLTPSNPIANMPPEKKQEKRRSPRASHDSVLEIYDADGHLIIGIGRLMNFSNVGICFSSSKVLEIGQQVIARMRLLKEGALEASARVVWIKKKPNTLLYGVEFDSIQKIQPSVV